LRFTASGEEEINFQLAYCVGVCRVLLGKPEGKRPLGRLRRRWEDNIKKWDVELGTGSSFLGIGKGGGDL